MKEGNLTSDSAIGLTPKVFPLNKLPGGTRKATYSYGYRSDGIIMYNKAMSSTQPTITTGCTFGCGVNMIERSIFFTINGDLIRKVISL